MRVADVITALERIAPTRFSLSGDPVGLQLGSRDLEVTTAVVALDHSLSAVAYAKEQRAELLVTHHPIFYRGTTRVTDDTPDGRVATAILRAGMAHISAHTNWDCARGGISDTLAARLELADVRSIGTRSGTCMPEAGAEDADATLTRIGVLADTLVFRDFNARVAAQLRTKVLAWGDPAKAIRRVAVSGGAADGEWKAALEAGADAFVTGEVQQHVALEAADSGLVILAAGHYATEQPGCVELAQCLTREIPNVRWRLFEPAPGVGGRPALT